MKHTRHPLFYSLYNGIKKAVPQMPKKKAYSLACKRFYEIMRGDKSKVKYLVGNKVAEKYANSGIVYTKLEVK